MYNNFLNLICIINYKLFIVKLFYCNFHCINLHNFSSSLYGSLEKSPRRSCRLWSLRQFFRNFYSLSIAVVLFVYKGDQKILELINNYNLQNSYHLKRNFEFAIWKILFNTFCQCFLFRISLARSLILFKLQPPNVKKIC